VWLVGGPERLLLSGDTLFRGAWGRTDFAGGDEDQMIDSLARLAALPPDLRVLPGHGAETTIERERAWLDSVRRDRRLPI
jgi:hydroxyacylglutathione hydrolase